MLPNPYLTVIGADPRRLLHAIRFDNANWTPTGNVEDQAGNPGFITSVATAADGAVLHLFVAAGSVFHAIRNADGTWTRFENVASRSGAGWFGTLQVPAAVVNGDIQLCGVAQEGRLIHAVHSAGAWSPPDDVFTRAGGPASTFLHAACANHNGELFVAAAPLGFNGILYTTRHDDGTWDPMNALVELSPDPTGQMLRVACASVLQDIHVVSVEAGGRLRHILLDPAAGGTSVSDFLDIKSITGNPGVVAGVAAANCANELHVMLTTNAPDNWRHSIRRANGTWQPFGDVWEATDGARGAQFSAIACARQWSHQYDQTDRRWRSAANEADCPRHHRRYAEPSDLLHRRWPEATGGNRPAVIGRWNPVHLDGNLHGPQEDSHDRCHGRGRR